MPLLMAQQKLGNKFFKQSGGKTMYKKPEDREKCYCNDCKKEIKFLKWKLPAHMKKVPKDNHFCSSCVPQRLEQFKENYSYFLKTRK